MNLKIKCDTPKEQVLVLRKFKKLVPECRWSLQREPIEIMPFADFNTNEVCLILNEKLLCWTTGMGADYPTFTASDFLRDDWKMEPTKTIDKVSTDRLDAALKMAGTPSSRQENFSTPLYLAITFPALIKAATEDITVPNVKPAGGCSKSFSRVVPASRC